MRKIFLVMLLLLLWSAANVHAQVTIGSDNNPHPGAVLDLQSTKGFKLPAVALLDADNFQLSIEQIDEAVGMMVYNTNATMANSQGEGVYVWNGSKWMFMSVSNGAVAVPVTGVSVSGAGGVTSLLIGTTLQLTATVSPIDATIKTVNWTIVSGSSYATVSSSGLVTGTGIGSVKVRATSTTDDTQSGEITLTVSQTGSTTVPGSNGTYNVYCYPGDVGCWMTDNSKEGVYIADTYPGQTAGERGYYYTWDQASSACPTGYRLASKVEWQNLKYYLSTSASEAEKDHWISSSELAGLYYIGDDWYDWDNYGLWWTSTASQYFYAGIDFLGTVYTDPDQYISVRCIRGESVPVTQITVSPSGASVVSGQAEQFSVNVTPGNATHPYVSWLVIPGTGSGTISSAGLFTAGSPGSVTIRATATDGSGVSGEQSATVTPSSVTSVSVSIAGGATGITIGTTLQLTATVLPNSAPDKSVSWTILSGGSYATVSSSGLVTGTGVGSVKIRATSNANLSAYGDITLTVPQTGPTTVTGSRGTYNVYCYPNYLGCWMTDNSKEGTYTATTYYQKSAGERGYYYTWAQASGACPSGYYLPTQYDWNDLKSYINNSATPQEKSYWISSSELGGGFNAGMSEWAEWNITGNWWSSTSSGQVFHTNTSGMLGPDTYNYVYISVRCVKKIVVV